MFKKFSLLFIFVAFNSAADEDKFFKEKIKPLFNEYCVSCHGPEEMKSGLRVDQLDSSFKSKDLFHWQEILDTIEFADMPPEDEEQLTDADIEMAVAWISENLELGLIRDQEKNGSIRRLTKGQYRRTLQTLLEIDSDFTNILPDDAISKEGFRNNGDVLGLSPLQLEYYFNIASKALDTAIILPDEKPTIQNFKVNIGKNINPTPYNGKVILGSQSELVEQADFVVEQLNPNKNFPYTPFRMQEKYLFDDGYKGNGRVAVLKEFDHLAHSFFLSNRKLRLSGPNFSKPDHWRIINDGIALRGSTELSQTNSHFKIALRELPEQGRFRVKVNASKLNNEALLVQNLPVSKQAEQVKNAAINKISVPESGLYQLDFNYKNYVNSEIVNFTLNDYEYAIKARATLANKESLDRIKIAVNKNITRVQIDKIGDNQYLALQEVKLLSKKKDLSKSAKLTQSSNHKDNAKKFGAKQLIVKNRNQYAQTKSQSNPWMQVELSGAKLVDNIEIVNKKGKEKNLLGAKVSLFNGDELVQSLVINPKLESKSNSLALVYLDAGEHTLKFKHKNNIVVNSISLSPVSEPKLQQRYSSFSKRNPHVAVQMGIRLDHGSSLASVGNSQEVTETDFNEYQFEGVFENYSQPNVGKDNLNYLVGVREIGVTNQLVNEFETPRLLIKSIELEGPFYDQWPAKTYKNILGDLTEQTLNKHSAKSVIESFMWKAFRRPATEAEVDLALTVYSNATLQHKTQIDSVKDALLFVLTSPQFLFIAENSQSPEMEALDQYELASKLSYFFWNSPPDHQLLDLAVQGQLHAQVEQQVTRMIKDEKFTHFVNDFTSQWLQLNRFEVVNFDAKNSRKINQFTRQQLKQEPIEFINYLIANNLPIEQLINADFTLANDTVAKYYGYKNKKESGLKFIPVKHENRVRAGILSQASILAGLSNGHESNPVKRGAWLAGKIIDETPPPPQPNVPPVNEEDKSLTLAQKLAKHRDADGCRSCHKKIDPWGLALEQFDAVGNIKPNSEQVTTLPDGTKVNNFTEFKDYLVEDKVEQIAVGFAKHIASYAVGRSLKVSELAYIENNLDVLADDNYKMQDIVRFIVTSNIFMTK
ncbi:DUF1592 domain-containing protein [Thalassomonas sp. M1454]|uniref:DUF1592 domain-containing protein n=1 Tax=Thalassomonas sp. M1454 TaxID=2594477 RepID=UPI00163DCE69|nr:DUF1592 domain-containing protein [Thalassomonas sp. M1454]